jgi:hypothetical protein
VPRLAILACQNLIPKRPASIFEFSDLYFLLPGVILWCLELKFRSRELFSRAKILFLSPGRYFSRAKAYFQVPGAILRFPDLIFHCRALFSNARNSDLRRARYFHAPKAYF